MASSLNGTGVTFNDATQQQSARTGPGIQVFTASGTFTVPAGITSVRVKVYGGGGGGRYAGTQYFPGRGGYIEAIVPVTLGGTVAVTVGAGGTSGGGTGGTSSFGTLATATGGLGGTISNFPGAQGVGSTTGTIIQRSQAETGGAGLQLPIVGGGENGKNFLDGCNTPIGIGGAGGMNGGNGGGTTAGGTAYGPGSNGVPQGGTSQGAGGAGGVIVVW